MFRIHMLPADHGDCLWLEYGVQSAPKVILIDAGAVSAWPRLKAKINEEKQKRGGQLHLELFVVTHVDADQIGGAVKFLGEASGLGVTFGNVWFNGYFRLDNNAPPERDDILGAKQGERLASLTVSIPAHSCSQPNPSVERARARQTYNWNVCVDSLQCHAMPQLRRSRRYNLPRLDFL
ncbi:hypothetical protein [Paraburkholderia sp. MM5482-R1]|uniref:hypothetical protein n=1 Tax=unclassified Paraburkholderia TaxID=2615204 RepID=UPI003D1EDEA2